MKNFSDYNDYKKVVIIYHRVDNDGLGSFAVVNWFFGEINQYRRRNDLDKIERIPCGWNYGDEISEVLKELDYSKDTLYVMVDVSIKSVMKALHDNGGNLIYIDHHQTAIDWVIAEEMSFPGMMKSEIGTSAIKLAWEYFFETPVPRVVELISKGDTWDKSGDWTETRALAKALMVKFDTDIKSWSGSGYWIFETNLFTLINNEEELNSFIELGKMLNEVEAKTFRRYVKSGFEVTVAEKYKGIALITPQGGSIQFDSVKDEYELFVVINRVEEDKFTISMYKEPGDLPEFHIGKYMEEFYNGGGHESAAGGRITFKQFEKLNFEKVI